MKISILFKKMLICICNVLLFVHFSFGQTFQQTLRSQSQDIANNDFYGNSMSIDGDYAIIGARGEDHDSSGSNTLSNAGSAYILKKDQGGSNNWGQLVKLVAPDRQSSDRFGFYNSVAISGDYAVVGARNHDYDSNGNNSVNNAGAAYIFKKDQGGSDKWGFVKKLVAIQRNTSDQFGDCVAISGDYIVIGAQNQDYSDTSGSNYLENAGAVYIFKKDHGGADNWGLFKKIVTHDRTFTDFFGVSVGISGEHIVAGAFTHDSANGTGFLNEAGAAYIYGKNQGGADNWGLVKKLVASDRKVNDNFGEYVAISDSVIAIAAVAHDFNEAGTDSLASAGAVYVFEQNSGGSNNWGQVKKLVASDRTALDYFGISVASAGNYILVGASGQDSSASGTNYLSDAGAAYIFHRNQGGSNAWGQVQKIVNSDRATDDEFGEAVAVSEDFVFASSDADSGAVYIFDQICSSSDSLPTLADSTYTGRISQTDAQGWTHYCTFNRELLLSLKMGLSGAVVDADQVRLKIGASKAFSSTGTGGMISNTDGYSIIDRRWDVNPSTRPSADSTVGVKFHFTNAEYNAVRDSLLNHGGGSTKSTLDSVTDLNLFKAFNGAAFVDPHTVNGIVLVNGSTADTNTWVHTTHGTVDHTAEFTVSSFSGGGGGGGAGGGSGTAPLPVELLSFTAKAIAQHEIMVNWITASEIDHSHFELERSINGRDFQKIHHVLGAGISNEIKNYAFLDNQIPSNTKVVYYRLHQFDHDGSSTKSEIRKVLLNHDLRLSPIQFAPNPFKRQLVISMDNFDDLELEIAVYNLQGKRLFFEHMEMNENTSTHILNLDFLRSGAYVLQITNTNLRWRHVIIKQ